MQFKPVLFVIERAGTYGVSAPIFLQKKHLPKPRISQKRYQRYWTHRVKCTTLTSRLQQWKLLVKNGQIAYQKKRHQSFSCFLTSKNGLLLQCDRPTRGYWKRL